MKHLPKHLRPRWRYLAVGIRTRAGADLDRRGFQRELWFAAQNLLGDPGSADAGLSVLRFAFDPDVDPGTSAVDAGADAATGDDADRLGRGEAIVRVRRGEVDPARAALACVDAVDDYAVGLRVRGVSGTLRACEEKHCPMLADE
ncbi:MAG: Rpp14/Pop5 family protein [Haloferacaceae archaeon]